MWRLLRQDQCKTWMKNLNLLSKCVTMTSRLLYFPSVCLCQESTKVILVSHWRDNFIFTSRSSSESASIESRSGVYRCVQHAISIGPLTHMGYLSNKTQNLTLGEKTTSAFRALSGSVFSDQTTEIESNAVCNFSSAFRNNAAHCLRL